MKESGRQYQKPEMMNMNFWKPFVYGRSGGNTTACDDDMGAPECGCEGLGEDYGACTLE